MKRKQFISEVSDHEPIRIEPLFVDVNDFKKGEVRLHIRKMMEGEEMKLELTSGFGWDLVGSLSEYSETLAPGDSMSVSLQLTNRNGTGLRQIRPIPLQVNLGYQVPGLGEVKIPNRYFSRPILRRYIEEVGDLVIDGDLGDWSDLPLQLSQTSESDNEVSCNVKVDHAYLYLAARVLDDTILVDNDLPSWKQDGFGWELRMSSGQDVSGPLGATLFRINPSTSGEPQKFYRGDNWPQGVEYVAKANAEGYEVELKLPLSMLDDDWEEWSYMRINFFVDDKDRADDPVRLHWRPFWRSPDNIWASGVFFRK